MYMSQTVYSDRTKVLEVDVLLWKQFDLEIEIEDSNSLDHFQEQKIC